ncbi:MAG: MoaD/ThiS family protein [Promethearchaeota archaeon]
MIVKVKLFATLRRFGPTNVKLGESFPVSLDEAANIATLLKKLKITEDQAKIIMINGNPGEIRTILKQNDVVAIFPPVGGGVGTYT